MRILVATSDYPPEIGGMAEYSDFWVRELAALGHEVRVIVRVGVTQSEGRGPAIAATPVPWTTRSWLAPYFACKALTGAIRSHRPDFVMAHTWIGWAPALAWIKGRSGIRYTIAAHGAEILGPMKSTYYRFLMTQGIRGADRVFPVSAFTADAIAELGISRERITVIGNGVDTSRFHPAKRSSSLIARYNLEKKRVILTVGGLVERKGHDTVIRALVRLKDTHGDLVYMIAGGWALNTSIEHDLKRLVDELGITDRVIFTGYVPDEQLPDIYRLADVFVMTGREVKSRGWVEGFGISYLEAAASGLPIVATAAGGSLDALTDNNAILVPESDPDSTANAIRTILDEPSIRAKMITEGIDWANKNTWKRRIARAEEELVEILKWR